MIRGPHDKTASTRAPGAATATTRIPEPHRHDPLFRGATRNEPGILIVGQKKND